MTGTTPFKVQMIPPLEQIEIILSARTHTLVSALPDPNSMINDLKFSDFISVKISEILRYVEEHGFPNRNVAEEGGPHQFSDDDQLRIEKRNDNWVLFFAERGAEVDLETFPSRAAARNACVNRLYQSAIIVLNHRFLLAHPEISLPDPIEND